MLLGVVSVIEQLIVRSVLSACGFLEQLLSKTELLKRVFLRTFAAGLSRRDAMLINMV